MKYFVEDNIFQSFVISVNIFIDTNYKLTLKNKIREILSLVDDILDNEVNILNFIDTNNYWSYSDMDAIYYDDVHNEEFIKTIIFKNEEDLIKFKLSIEIK